MNQINMNIPWSEIGGAYLEMVTPQIFAKKLALNGLAASDKGMQNFVLGCCAGIGWYTWKFGSNYIYKHQLKDLIALWQEPYINMKQYWKETPASANTGIISRIWSYCIWGSEPPEIEKKEALSKAPTPCFFNERTEQIIEELSKGITEHAKAGRPFQNAIFYGPPGVGKTMVLQRIAQESCVNYMVLSGSSLREAIRSRTHLWELEKIFKKMERSTVPTILVIDECELLFMDRRLQQQQPGNGDSYDLLEAFLKYTGSPSKKFMIVLATNNLRIIDEAILDRMDYQVAVNPPALRERIAIIKANIPLKFQEADQKIWTDQKIADVAAATDGFSGRCLEKLLTRIAIKRDISPTKELTNEMIAQAVQECFSELMGAMMTIHPQIMKDLHQMQGQQQPPTPAADEVPAAG